MSNIKSDVDHAISLIERQLHRNINRECKTQPNENSSKYGYWDNGYFSGKVSGIEYVLDFLLDIQTKINEGDYVENNSTGNEG